MATTLLKALWKLDDIKPSSLPFRQLHSSFNKNVVLT